MASIPKPFSRPSVALGAASIDQREWRVIKARDVQVGDTVAGVGLVEKIVAHPDPNQVILSNVESTLHSLWRVHEVQAFVKVEG